MRKLLALTLLAAFAGSASAQVAVDWTWKKDHRCNNVSPALDVTGIPEGTKTLAFQMNDMDFQNKDHGGGTVAHESGGADGAELARGMKSKNFNAQTAK